jgi:hypothetical protein
VLQTFLQTTIGGIACIALGYDDEVRVQLVLHVDSATEEKRFDSLVAWAAEGTS